MTFVGLYFLPMDYILNHLDKMPDFLIYLVLGVSAFIENIFPPAPGDMIVAFGAFLVGADRLGAVSIEVGPADTQTAMHWQRSPHDQQRLDQA